MDATFGVILLLISWVCALYGLVAALRGAKRANTALIESARNATIIILPLLTVALCLLIIQLGTGEFGTQYVWAVTDRSMPTYLKITATWGGQQGSLLFWAWIMAAFNAFALLRNWQREQHLMPYVVATLSGTLLFFMTLVTFWENPFAQFWQSPDQSVQIATLFGPSAVLSAISQPITNLANLPGAIGIVFDGFIPWGAPPDYGALTPLDGRGLNPLLRHPGMIIHPPMLYIGFVGFTIPFAFAIAALAAGDLTDEWIRATRRWTLVAWLFLSFGLILGGWWAYDVLGWGGYWGWDPVENAAFMPWLTGTAFLHSVMIQEKRGMLKRWNMVLIILTFLQVILGTFATRSGFVSSVHSFAQSAIGPLFFIALVVATIVSFALLAKRWDALKSDQQLDGLLSRETMFLLNNLVFVSLNVAIFLYTYWPVITEVLAESIPTVERSSVGPEVYEATTAPLFLAMLFLMGVAPLVAWKITRWKRLGSAMVYPTLAAVTLGALIYLLGARNPWALIGYMVCFLVAAVTIMEFHRGAAARVKAHDEHYASALWTLITRDRRRYGGYMIHLGVVIIALGIISIETYQVETQQALRPGQTISLNNYVLEYEQLERFTATDGRDVTQAQAVVYRNGTEIAQITPRIDFHPNGQPMSIPAKVSNLAGDDFYVLLIAWELVDFSQATFKVYYNPLINWIWGGGAVFALGIIIAAWPDFAEERRAAVQRAAKADTAHRNLAGAAGD
ncbi:MAG: heme lyase CcmF/NrfE family subunit [Chloroflexi bacterium]|nr:heme lyase CcmF/NrfE family subunit [Chloroflexota bacterium]